MGRTPLAVCALWRVAPSQDMQATQTTPDPLGSRLCGRHQVTPCYSRTRKVSNQSANVSPRKGLVARTLMPLRSTATLTWHLGAITPLLQPKIRRRTCPSSRHVVAVTAARRPDRPCPYTPYSVAGDLEASFGAAFVSWRWSRGWDWCCRHRRRLRCHCRLQVSNSSIPPTPQRILVDAPEDSCRRRQNSLSAVDRHSAPESCSRSSRSQRPQPQLPSSSGAKAIPLPRLVRRVTARRSWHIMEQHVLRCRPWPRTSIDSNRRHAPWRMCDTGTANSRGIAIRAILCPSLALGGRGQCSVLNRAIARHNLLSEELPCRGLSPAPSPAPQATRSSSQSQSVLRTRR
jgi:hypothetical protein